MIDLADLLDEYGGEVYADFQREYSINLVAEIRDGSRSPGEILALIWNLSEDSSFAKSMGGAERAWSIDRLMTMDVANQLRILNYYYLSAHNKKSQSKPELHKTPAQEAAEAEEVARNTYTPETLRYMEEHGIPLPS